MDKILITGVGGNVGQYIAKKLNEKNYNIIGTYRNRKPQNVKYKIINVDLSKDVIECDGIDIIIHIAAGIEGTCESLVIDNIISTNNLIRYAEKYNVKKFIYISTVSVYGTIDEVLKENSDVKNPTIYGMTKLICEKLLEESKIPSKYIIGLPRMLGPYVDLNNVGNSGFLKMVKKILENEDVNCNIPEVEYNNYMHVDDLVSFLEHILNKNEDYCKVLLGSKDTYTMYEILNIMKECINSTSEIIKSVTDKMPYCSVIDIEKAVNCGYSPQGSKESLERFMQELALIRM